MKYEDHRRGNLIQFLPLRKSDRVLLVGRDSACLEEALKPLVAEVTTLGCQMNSMDFQDATGQEFAKSYIGQEFAKSSNGQGAQWSVVIFYNSEKEEWEYVWTDDIRDLDRQFPKFDDCTTMMAAMSSKPISVSIHTPMIS